MIERFKGKLKKQAEVDNEDDNDDEDNGDVEAHLMKQTEDEIKKTFIKMDMTKTEQRLSGI